MYTPSYLPSYEPLWVSNFASRGGVPLWVSGAALGIPADLAFDLVNDRARIGGALYTSASMLTVARASAAYADDTSGVWTAFAANTARRTNRGLLVEESRTNSIRNNSMQGAVVGTSGTAPSNWSSNTTFSGLTRTIVGTGTENGVEYIDIQYSGTANSTSVGAVSFETTTQIGASNGQTWAQSTFVKLAAGTLNGVTLAQRISMRDAGGTALSGLDASFTPTGTITRIASVQTLNNASTAFVLPQILITPTNGAVIDFTLRIGWPQLELGASVSSPIRTTNAATVRSADVVYASVPAELQNASGYSFLVDFTYPSNAVAASKYPAVAALRSSAYSSQNTLEIFAFKPDVTNRTSVLIRNGGVTQQTMDALSLTLGSRYVQAFAVDASTCAAYSQGTQIGNTTGATITFPANKDRLYFGSNSSADVLNGYIRAVSVWGSRITNTNMAMLTGWIPGFRDDFPADLAFDFAQDLSWNGETLGNSTSLLSVTRASTGYADNAAGVWTSFGNNVARRTNKGLLVEEARTNSIRNSSMQGAVAGTPGTTPTYWSVTGATSGLTRTIVGTGTENGIDYVDMRWSGTASGTTGGSINFEANTIIAATVGQVWSASAFCTLVGGSLAGISSGITLEIREGDSGGGVLSIGTAAITPAAGSLGAARWTLTRTLASATTAFTTARIAFNTLTNGAAIDFTLRIGWPQLEQGGSVTSPIRTTGTSGVRSADTITYISPFDMRLTGSMAWQLTAPSASQIALGTIVPLGISNVATPEFNNSIYSTITTTSCGLAVVSGGGGGVSLTNRAPTASALNEYAGSWSDVAGAARSLNGLAADVDATLTSPATSQTQIKIGSAPWTGGTNFLNGFIQSAAFWRTRVSETNLRTLTT